MQYFSSSFHHIIGSIYQKTAYTHYNLYGKIVHTWIPEIHVAFPHDNIERSIMVIIALLLWCLGGGGDV